MIQFSFFTPVTRRLCVAGVAGTTALMLLAGVGHAQVDPATALPVAPIITSMRFESVISRYKPMTDQKLGSWREANDTVTRIGGWRAYLKESQSPEAVTPEAAGVPATVVPPATPVTANPHAGHGARP
jgi:hypothetical protein